MSNNIGNNIFSLYDKGFKVNRKHYYNIPKRLVRLGIILILGVIARILFGCGPFIQDISYNGISVDGLDNSRDYMSHFWNTKDTLYSEAVALNLCLSDTSYYSEHDTVYDFSLNSLSFTGAMATSIDYRYVSKNKVLDIKIHTLFDIDNKIKAGDNIEDIVLYAVDSYHDDLYKSENQAISSLNGIKDSPRAVVYLVLKTPVKNTKAQFKVDVLLDDDKHLSCVTDTFTIIQNSFEL